MPKPLSTEAFTNIQAQALLHILKGGGIVPDDGATDIEDVIGNIAVEHFTAKRAIDDFDQALVGVQLETCDRISSAAWGIVGVHEYAAFTFGATVALQIRRLSAPRRSRLNTRKGGR